MEEGAEGWPGSSAPRGHLSTEEETLREPLVCRIPNSLCPMTLLLPGRAASGGLGVRSRATGPHAPRSALTPGNSWAHFCSSCSLVRKPWPPGLCNRGRHVTKGGPGPAPASCRASLGGSGASPGAPCGGATALPALPTAARASSCRRSPLWAGLEAGRHRGALSTAPEPCRADVRPGWAEVQVSAWPWPGPPAAARCHICTTGRGRGRSPAKPG